MRRSLILTLALWLLLSCTVGLVVLSKRSQLISEKVARLHLLDCEIPCWAGITPGSTSMSNIQGILQHHFGNDQLRMDGAGSSLFRLFYFPFIGVNDWSKFQTNTIYSGPNDNVAAIEIPSVYIDYKSFM